VVSRTSRNVANITETAMSHGLILEWGFADCEVSSIFEDQYNKLFTTHPPPNNGRRPLPSGGMNILDASNCPDRPSWPGGVARSAGVVVQGPRIALRQPLFVEKPGSLAQAIQSAIIEPPPSLRHRRSHPSWPGGAIAQLLCQSGTLLPFVSTFTTADMPGRKT